MSDKRYVYLVCAGGHAKQVIDVFLENGYEIRGAFDDHKEKGNFFYRDVVILGKLENIKIYNNEPFFCTIGDNIIREKICDNITNVKWINCISCHAYVSPSVTLGFGNYIGVHSKVLGGSILGDFNIINDGATLTHDNIIGNFNHIAPNASLGGRIMLGNSNLIGTNSTINPDVKIGDNFIIGSGTVVLKTLLIPGTYVGIPCRKLN